jgi:glutamyl-tRNA reductase
MSTLVVGLSHRTAPLAVLERVALAPDAVGKLLDDVGGSGYVSETLVLSTCNRVEVYAEVPDPNRAAACVTELLARHGAIAPDELRPHLHVGYEAQAVTHLFSVACGLDSMAVGESQVLGQLRTALRTAREAGHVGRHLGFLAEQALRVGKRVRVETDIDHASRSLVDAGLEEATQMLGSLDRLTALVVGAGAMSTVAASVVARSGCARILVTNRTLAHAQRLAQTVNGEAVPLSLLSTALLEADLVVSCVGSVEHVLDADLLASRARCSGRPLVILDLAVPRDVDPNAHTLDGVTVIDLETLSGTLSARDSAADVEAARAIVAEEVDSIRRHQLAECVTQSVVTLHAMANAVIESELDRLAGRQPDLDTRLRAELEHTARRIVRKVLHAPTVRVKQLSGGPGGQIYADALVRLFDLDQSDAEG